MRAHAVVMFAALWVAGCSGTPPPGQGPSESPSESGSDPNPPIDNATLDVPFDQLPINIIAPGTRLEFEVEGLWRFRLQADEPLEVGGAGASMMLIVPASSIAQAEAGCGALPDSALFLSSHAVPHIAGESIARGNYLATLLSDDPETAYVTFAGSDSPTDQTAVGVASNRSAVEGMIEGFTYDAATHRTSFEWGLNVTGPVAFFGWFDVESTAGAGQTSAAMALRAGETQCVGTNGGTPLYYETPPNQAGTTGLNLAGSAGASGEYSVSGWSEATVNHEAQGSGGYLLIPYG